MSMGRRLRTVLVGVLALLLGACAAATPPPAATPGPAPPRPRRRPPRPHLSRRRRPRSLPRRCPCRRVSSWRRDTRTARGGSRAAATSGRPSTSGRSRSRSTRTTRLAKDGRRQLEARLERTVTERLGQGKDALAKGDNLEARRHFLAVLAMDPTNQAAFSAIQNDVKEIRFVPHTVKAGETLATIAERYYGDRARSEVIWETNQLPPNPRLTAGMTLKIPEIPGVPFVLPELRPKPPEPAARPDAAPPDTARPTETVEINPLLVGARESLEKGEFQVALADVDRVLASNAQNPDAVELKKAVLYGLGKSQFGQKKYDDSVKTLVQLTRLTPTYQDSPTLLKQARTSAAQQHYAQGLQLYREEKLEDAITQWKAVLEYDPDHVNAKKNIDQAERLLKNLQQRQQPKKP